MPGYNHHSSCTCGWCLKSGGGSSGKVLYWGGIRTPSFNSYHSFTTPNATCPVCGESVFFYQSPLGGRVFFDELGPPWPKHSCTDNSSLKVQQLVSARPRHPPAWRKVGWQPIRIRSSGLDGNWHLIPVQNVLTGLRYDALAGAPLRLQGETCGFMLPWDENGWSKISFVELDGFSKEVVVSVFEKTRYFQTSCSMAVDQRKKVVGP